MSGPRVKPPVDIGTSDTIATSGSGTDAVAANDAGATAVTGAPPATDETTADAQLATGQTIGRFVVIKKLGAGAMGIVYAAWDPQLDRKVAIKLLQGETVDSEEARLRMLREAQAMARIDHPNVLRVYEAGTFGERVYIAMEFAADGTLKQWLAASRRSPHALAAVFAQAARGLSAAHAAGLVHRDFKPENVLMFAGDCPRVTDFGIVGVAGELPSARPSSISVPLSEHTPLSKALTRTGTLMGTPAYMAPEQFEGASIGAAADQFALCVALYTALFGAPPFAGATFAELAANVLHGEIAPPPRGNAVPARLRRAVLRGLATDPAKRFPSLAELIAELERDPRRPRRIAAGMIAGTLAIGAIAYLALAHKGPPPCTGGDERAATAWNPSVKQQMARAFAETKHPDADSVLARVAPIFDRWRDRWRDAYVGACVDTRVRGIQSEHALDLRMTCLDRRLDQARATIALLAQGGRDAVDHAIDAAQRLPELAPCSDASWLKSDGPPPDATDVAEVNAVFQQLAGANAQILLGRYAAALAVAQKTLVAAKPTQYLPVIADTEYTLGLVDGLTGDPGAAELLAQAMRDGIAAGYTELVLRAAAERLLYMPPSQFAAADEVAVTATAIAARWPYPDTVVNLDAEIGQLRINENKLADAEQVLAGAVALGEKQLPPDANETTRARLGLGTVAALQRRFADAQTLFEQVLESDERVLGSDHPDVATALDNLANAYNMDDALTAEQQKAKTVPLRQRALAIRLRVLGPDHPDVASSYANFGDLDAMLGDDVAAKDLLEKAVAIFDNVDPDSLDEAEALTTLGTVLEDLGDYDGARGRLERALAIRTRALGSDDARLAEPLDELGVVADKQQRYTEALADQHRAYQLASGDPDALYYLASQSATLADMGKLAEARDLAMRVEPQLEQAFGADHPYVAELLGKTVGPLLQKLGDAAGALASCRRAQQIAEAKRGADHPLTGDALACEGDALVALHRAAEAKPLVARALAIYTHAHHDGDANRIKARLAALR